MEKVDISKILQENYKLNISKLKMNDVKEIILTTKKKQEEVLKTRIVDKESLKAIVQF